MEKEVLLDKIDHWVGEMLTEEPEYFLVNAKIKPTNNIKVYLDGDKGINIDKCIRFNRMLRAKIEEAGIFPEGDFSLEVSSPGIDEPLKSIRQYKKNIGRKVEITFNDTEKKQKEGKLIEVNEETVVIEEKSGKGKNAKTENVSIPLHEIKKTVVQIQF